MFKMWNGSKCNLILVNLKSSVLASGLFEAKINNKPRTKIPRNFFMDQGYSKLFRRTSRRTYAVLSNHFWTSGCIEMLIGSR